MEGLDDDDIGGAGENESSISDEHRSLARRHAKAKHGDVDCNQKQMLPDKPWNEPK